MIPDTPAAVSINRVRVVDLPGLPVDAEVRGRAAYHLLSGEAVVVAASPYAGALGLDDVEFHVGAADLSAAPTARRAIPRRVDAQLHSEDAAARAAAWAVGRRLGRNLAYILLTLHRGDAVNRAARPDWTAAEWRRWSRVRRVWLGGGVMSGDLGCVIVAEARALLQRLGYGDVLDVESTPYRGSLSLVGAARYLPSGPRRALCFDFGHTLVKGACFSLEGATLAAMEWLPATPTHWVHRNVPESARRYTGEEVRDFVVDVLARALREHPVDGDDLVLSVAAYVCGGRLLGNGVYARISDTYGDAGAALEAAVRARTGRAVRLHFIHDGTAAAALHAGTPGSAVIVVGTALGVGFPPSTATGLLALGGREGVALKGNLT
ncbi:MAG: hypothetical protein ACP5HM_02665 [Anaerolineae bacterium]